MPIAVTCRCGRSFAAPDHLLGKTVPCPACRQALPIVAHQPAASSVAPRPQLPAKIAVACPCGQRFEAEARLYGKSVTCPVCGGPLRIPVPRTTLGRAATAPGIAAAAAHPRSASSAADPLGIGDLNAGTFGMGTTANVSYSGAIPNFHGGPYGPSPVNVPRPRHRPKLSKETLRRGLAITAGVAGMVLLGIVAYWGRDRIMPVVNLFRGPQWMLHQSPEDGYEVEVIRPTAGVILPSLPAHLPNVIATAHSKYGPGTLVGMELLPVYVDEADLPILYRKIDAHIFARNFQPGSQFQVKEQKECTFGGVKAKELFVEFTEGGHTVVVRMRFMVHRKRAFRAIYLALKDRYRDEDADRFFHSFTLSAASTASDAQPLKNGPQPQETYQEVRRSFRTKLTRQIPSPQVSGPVIAPPGATIVHYQSGDLSLQAVVSEVSGTGKRPAVLYCHGGFAYGPEDWDQVQPYLRAGYVVMIPVLRGENQQPGNFSLFYNEVDDVLAAAEVLAQHPDVDDRNLFVAGHSAGGTLAALSALASARFRACATFSGTFDMNREQGNPAFPAVFEPSDPLEWHMRSARFFARHFPCPARLYYGTDEIGYATVANNMVGQGTILGQDIRAVPVPGDHATMLDTAIPHSIQFFEEERER